MIRKRWVRECEEIERSAAPVHQDLKTEASLVVNVEGEQYLLKKPRTQIRN